jgi:hypothetical protein
MAWNTLPGGMRSQMDGSKLEATTPTEPDTAGSAEEGRTALRVREGAPSWLKPLLYGVIVIGALFIFMSMVMGWAPGFLLIGIAAAVIGLGIAVNPRRASPAGGSEQP